MEIPEVSQDCLGLAGAPATALPGSASSEPEVSTAGARRSPSEASASWADSKAEGSRTVFRRAVDEKES